MITDNPFTEANAEEEQGGNFFIDFLETIVIALAISIVIYLTIAIPNQVEGQSMEPNFYDKELLFTNKTVQWMGPTSVGQSLGYDYRRGDVIIFHHQSIDLIKRVIAVEGDKIKIADGKVYVNDKELQEDYLPVATRTDLPSVNQASLPEGENVVVPKGSYFLMGDNRRNSKDSRYKDIGFVSRNDLKGQVLFRYWPLTRIGLIRRGEFSEKSN